MTADHQRRLRLHAADFTPTPVVRQGVKYLRANGMWPHHHLDPCAGAGVFSMVVREEFTQCRSTALEIREEENRHLNNNAHDHSICDALQCLRERRPFLRNSGPVDLVLTNPAFDIIHELLPLCLQITRARGWIVFLGIGELGQRSEDGIALFDKYTPSRQVRIAGPIHFRGKQINPKTEKPYGSDLRSYSWWMWESDGRGGSTERNSWFTADRHRRPGRGSGRSEASRMDRGGAMTIGWYYCSICGRRRTPGLAHACARVVRDFKGEQ